MMKPELCRPVVASLMTTSNETLKTRTQSGNREASRHYNDLLIGNVSDCGCLDTRAWHSLQYSLISQIYYTRFLFLFTLAKCGSRRNAYWLYMKYRWLACIVGLY